MGSQGHEHRDLGLPRYPCARLRIWPRDGSGNNFSLPYMILSTRGKLPRSRERGLILCKLSTLCRTGPHELPLDRNACRYTLCRVRKQSKECESENRLVKSQRSGVALTERGGSWGLGGSCIAAIAAERPLCPHGIIPAIFFQPEPMCGIPASFRSPSRETASIIFFERELEWNRINLGRFSVRAIAHVRHLSLFFYLPPSVGSLEQSLECDADFFCSHFFERASNSFAFRKIM